MDFIDQIKTHAKTIQNLKEKIQTEEGTKNALIMPFITILGYNVFDPDEVNPEYVADVGTKKGEKVDYAILKDGKPCILIECKAINSDLNKEQASQLYRYFSVTPARIGILTNGIIYRFFTDLEKENTMDVKPFLEINLLDIKEPLIEQLKNYTKQGLNLDELHDTATQLKYTKEIIQIANKEFSEPSEDFVKFFAQQVYPRKLTQKALENFSAITKESLDQFLSEKINERLKSAMKPEPSKTPDVQSPENKPVVEPTDVIVTTEEEWEGYYFVKAILHDVIDPSKIVIRDAKSYCAILYENNNRRPICRLYFDGKQKYVGVFNNKDREETKIPISSLQDIFTLGDQLKATVAMYQIPAPKTPQAPQ
ncbi:type I restriction endonuclease [Methanoregula sp. UBA64]|jgi:predicted type IV restriction endonuclease|uniref:type I restriction endonuclease n=1 Tax=Methanoregula sp. UBA64 TaxID=1915554 RepID=UPI0025E09BEC|nr:type I restriction endonuclease [Methanoregula sp. UBA64]